MAYFSQIKSKHGNGSTESSCLDSEKINYPEEYQREDLYYLPPGVKINIDTAKYREIELRRTRKTLVDWISRAFSHYYNQLGTGKKKTLKSLKKTFLTSLELYLGRGRNSLTHSNQRTLTTHYIDSRVIAKEAAKEGFRVF